MRKSKEKERIKSTERQNKRPFREIKGKRRQKKAANQSGLKKLLRKINENETPLEREKNSKGRQIKRAVKQTARNQRDKTCILN